MTMPDLHSAGFLLKCLHFILGPRGIFICGFSQYATKACFISNFLTFIVKPIAIEYFDYDHHVHKTGVEKHVVDLLQTVFISTFTARMLHCIDQCSVSAELLNTLKLTTRNNDATRSG